MRCHVIIPVGPGHEEIRNRALESVRIACKTGQGLFADVRVRMVEDLDGGMGRSKARNFAVGQSDSEWIFFLDSDDVLHPQAFEAVAELLNAPDTVAVFGQIAELAGGCVIDRYQAPVTCYSDLLDTDPYLTLQMGHFVRTDIAKTLPFAELLDCGEDVDYYLRLWQAHGEHCHKIDVPLMVNDKSHHSTGPRSATGQQWRAAVTGILDVARSAENEAA